jgi:hypothetical protein
MNNTQTQIYQDLLRKALGKKSSNTKARKLDVKKNYSSFWMDDLGKGSDRFGISSDFAGKGGDLVRSVKLNSYRRAIANFVKILTSQEIPVKFHGSDSYTDGKSVTISTDIKDNNFDVSVGLALHEASHILLTDFDLLPALRDGKIEAAKHLDTMLVKDLLNYVEDRRIDHYVFSTSPGYKAYYHKLYEHYWNNDKTVMKGLLSAKYRNAAELDSWMFQIINMMNPAFDASVMPGLQEIVSLIGIPTISRLKSTQDALDVAIAVAQIITDQMAAAKEAQASQPQPEQGQEGEQGEEGEGEGQGTSSKDLSESNDSSESNDGSESNDLSGEEGDESEGGEDSGEEGEEGEDADGGNGTSLSAAEEAAIAKVLREQRKFMDGESDKKQASKSLERKLDKVEKQQATIESVHTGITCLNYDVTGKDFIAAASAGEMIDKYRKEYNNAPYGSVAKEEAERKHKEAKALRDLLDPHYFGTSSQRYTTAISKGLLMGQLMGRKLQMRNESRERVDNRLRSGKIDNRRLSAAGYGIESIFQQVTIDKYKKANLHISLDGSGSMGGKNWENTAMMTAAIAKAITYTQNVAMQISIRVTSYDGSTLPVNYFIYDSRKNTLRELEVILGAFSPNGMTPEGLCFESMIKKNQLVRASADMDSYFVNLSDGGPGGVGNYSGVTAMEHTKAQVTKMRNEYGMGVLSYFMSEYAGNDFASNSSGRMFQGMYGKAATTVTPDNAMEIAKTLNKLFMNK